MQNELPAAKVIRLLGAKAIAHACWLTTDAVWKWPKRPGGMIPSRHLPTVLELAATKGIRLTAEQALGIAA